MFGDSILLANVIFIIRRAIQTFSGSEDDHRNDILKVSSKTLELICRFDIQKTLPEHQRISTSSAVYGTKLWKRRRNILTLMLHRIV